MLLEIILHVVVYFVLIYMSTAIHERGHILALRWTHKHMHCRKKLEYRKRLVFWNGVVDSEFYKIIFKHAPKRVQLLNMSIGLIFDLVYVVVTYIISIFVRPLLPISISLLSLFVLKNLFNLSQKQYNSDICRIISILRNKHIVYTVDENFNKCKGVIQSILVALLIALTCYFTRLVCLHLS